MDKITKLKCFFQNNGYVGTQTFANCNSAGDEMVNIYEDDGITVDFCYYWDYLEIFGLSEKEFLDLVPYGAGNKLRNFDEVKEFIND